uniref:Uncharacterized protein n=1 Tax=Lepeophtheirus salmonis TaxID=72036 RepID=A0A0K2V801_LEPSM
MGAYICTRNIIIGLSISELSLSGTKIINSDLFRVKIVHFNKFNRYQINIENLDSI